MTDHETGTSRPERRIRWGHVIRLTVATAAIGFLVLFSILNSGDVKVDYAFGSAEAPMIVVIVVSAVAGFVVGAIAGRSGSRS